MKNEFISPGINPNLNPTLEFQESFNSFAIWLLLKFYWYPIRSKPSFKFVLEISSAKRTPLLIALWVPLIFKKSTIPAEHPTIATPGAVSFGRE